MKQLEPAGKQKQAKPLQRRPSTRLCRGEGPGVRLREWYLHRPADMAKTNKSIYSALVANLLIAVTKFIAGGVTNSSSMISEGVHSMVDTVNEVLLLYGIRQSKQPADAIRPFGYGKELYFWSFIVAILIFGLGGGISIYQGIIHILHPEPLGDPKWNYIVLALSIAFEGTSLVIAIKEFNANRGETGWWTAIVKSKDPSSFLVLFEDSAAVTGLLIVGILMFIEHQNNMPVLDGVASVLVGLLLVAVSLILARESRSLLMGEGMSADTQRRIRSIVEKDLAVEKVLNVLSTYEAPEAVLLMLRIVFKTDLSTAEITEAIDRVKTSIRKEYRLIKFIIIQPDELEVQPVRV